MEKATLTVAEAAKVLGISVPKMYELTCSAGFYPLLKVGRKKLVHAGAFERWMLEQTGQPQGAKP